MAAYNTSLLVLILVAGCCTVAGLVNNRGICITPLLHKWCYSKTLL